MFLMMLAILGAVTWLVYLAVTDGPRRRAHGQITETKEILDHRLAKGDIDDDEYRRMRELLEDKNRVPVGARRS